MPFKVIRVVWATTLGTTHEFIQEVECPKCLLKFFQKCSSGCFHHHCDPPFCPQCNYPFEKLMKIKGKKEPDINPSRRLKENE